MKIIVTGVTLSGNLGGYAMLLAVKDVLAPKIKDFALASILPKRDKAINKYNDLRIMSSDYKIWLMFTTPLCMLLWPFRKKKFIIWCARKIPILKYFSDIDAVIDLSGIAFVDKRGFALLIYNIAIVLPGLFCDKPVYKLSQALGPFNKKINQTSAIWILNRCQKVIARGEKSLANLRAIGIKNVAHYPDTSFALNISRDTRKKALDIVKKNVPAYKTTKLILISPSAVVENYCKKTGLNLVDEFCKTIYSLSIQGMHCALIAHSTDTGIAKNDDLSVITSIQNRYKIKYNTKITMFDSKGDPRFARAIIGMSEVFIACRFHSLIAALSQAVPVITIGWSHKYQEAASPFLMEPYTMDYSHMNAEVLVKYVNDLIERRKIIINTMKIEAKRSKKRATEGIKIILGGKNKINA